MAQSIDNIQADIIEDLVALAAAAGLTITPAEWSDYDYRQLLTRVTAIALGVEQQLWDSFNGDIEAMIAAASPQTGPWFRAQMYRFQYSATDPQIYLFDSVNGTYAPYYAVVNTALCIIKYAYVVPGVFGTTVIKVAKQTAGAPDALSLAELAAAQSFVNLLSIGGINYNVTSGVSDKIYIAATIWYQGIYSGVISDNVIAAITTYLGGIPFAGVVLLSGLELAIRAVPGVNDVVFSNVQARADTTAYGSGTNLVIGVDGIAPTGNVVQRNWPTSAGYIIPEDTPTHELTDSLTFVSE